MADLQSAALAENVKVSVVVRRRLGFSSDERDRVDDLDRRVSRLEEMAGL